MRMYDVDQPFSTGTVKITIGYGSAGGLAAWQLESGKLHTQLLDRAGNPSGSLHSFSAPELVNLSMVRALSNGFVILAQDFSEFAEGHWFVWLTDAAGRIVDRLNLDEGLHDIDGVSPVVADRMLFFFSNDRSKNMETSRVLVLTLSGGRIRRQRFDFPVDMPALHEADGVQLALGAQDWSVWIGTQEPAQLLGPRGQRAGPPLRFPNSGYHTLNLRYLGDTLQALTAVDDGNGDVVVPEAPEAERDERGESGTASVLRVDTLEPGGAIQPGKPFTFVPTGELPAPFANELELSFGADTANRSTLIGLHAVGAPISLQAVSPPITDALIHASAAWSSTHWVIAYFSETEDGGSVNVFGIRCGP